MGYVQSPYQAYDYQDLTVDNTVGGVGFTGSKINPTNARQCEKVLCTLETAQIRFTLDGTAPLTTKGHIVEAGDTLEIEGAGNIFNFRAIRTGGSSGTFRVTLMR